MLRRLFKKYKNFAIVTLPRFYRKVPKGLWVLAGAFGFFVLGVIFGFYWYANTPSLEEERVSKKSDSYLNLIYGYEDLSELYNYQGQNVGVITDPYVLENNPEEFYMALDSIKEYRNKILVQQGRIMELRKQAGILDSEKYPQAQ